MIIYALDLGSFTGYSIYNTGTKELTCGWLENRISKNDNWFHLANNFYANLVELKLKYGKPDLIVYEHLNFAKTYLTAQLWGVWLGLVFRFAYSNNCNDIRKVTVQDIKKVSKGIKKPIDWAENFKLKSGINIFEQVFDLEVKYVKKPTQTLKENIIARKGDISDSLSALRLVYDFESDLIK